MPWYGLSSKKPSEHSKAIQVCQLEFGYDVITENSEEPWPQWIAGLSRQRSARQRRWYRIFRKPKHR